MTTDTASQDRYVELVREAQGMRGAVRSAADDGDVAEVARLLRRAIDLRADMLALRLVNARHPRATGRHPRYGHNPGLEAAEQELSEWLAPLGIPSHLRGA